jgi:hypothetical protein
MGNKHHPIARKRTLEKTLYILAGVNCIFISMTFAYSEVTHSGGRITSIFPLPGVYFIELIAIGILCFLAVFLLNNQSISIWSGISWICSGLLFAFIILGAWTIGFYLIPGMLMLLAVSIMIDKRTQGEIALHLIYFIAAGLSQGVLVFLTLLV